MSNLIILFSVVGIATGYDLEGRGVGVRVAVGQDFFLHVVQTRSGAYPASYTMGTGDSIPGIKAAEDWSWSLLLTSVDVKKTWFYTCTPSYIFLAKCLST
jgi:hypothetical protein